MVRRCVRLGDLVRRGVRVGDLVRIGFGLGGCWVRVAFGRGVCLVRVGLRLGGSIPRDLVLKCVGGVLGQGRGARDAVLLTISRRRLGI